MLREGHQVCRLQLRPEGEPVAPFSRHLFDRTTNTLVEAKGTIARSAFRMRSDSSLTMRACSNSPPKKVILRARGAPPDLLSLAKPGRQSAGRTRTESSRHLAR